MESSQVITCGKPFTEIAPHKRKVDYRLVGGLAGGRWNGGDRAQIHLAPSPDSVIELFLGTTSQEQFASPKMCLFGFCLSVEAKR